VFHQRRGDVLVSRSSARADRYSISLINEPGQTVAPRFDEAMDTAKKLANRHRVDAWYTCDHIHFVSIGRYRPAAGRPTVAVFFDQSSSAERRRRSRPFHFERSPPE
jgi:hypothetical protein